MLERGRLVEVRLGSQGLLRFAMVSCVLARQSRRVEFRFVALSPVSAVMVCSVEFGSVELRLAMAV
jgi:hypothetical protein